jgi:hypothetical protein
MDEVTTVCVNCQATVTIAIPDDVRDEDGDIVLSQEAGGEALAHWMRKYPAPCAAARCKSSMTHRPEPSAPALANTRRPAQG